jgi:hypothetical protein
MAAQLRELSRVCRSGGRLAVTTWGPRVLEPGASIWWNAVKEVRPDLVPATSPWERITDPLELRNLFDQAGIADVEIAAEQGRPALRSPNDWWAIALGSGFRWTVEQLGGRDCERVRLANVERIRRDDVRAVETNAIFAIANKPAPPQHGV